MKKIVLILLVAMFVSFNSFDSFAAEMTYMNNFYVGQFELNHANWDKGMEAQLMSKISMLPQVKNFKVYGHTNNSGPEAFNQMLAKKRADLVAKKLKSLFPDSKVEVFARIYKPEDGQMVDYKMVKVEVYAEPQVVAVSLKKSIQSVSNILQELKNRTPEQKVDLSKLENSLSSISKSIAELRKGQFDLSDDLDFSDGDKGLYLAMIQETYLGLQKSFTQLKSEQAIILSNLQKDNTKIKESIRKTDGKIDSLVKAVHETMTETYLYFALSLLLFALAVLAFVIISDKMVTKTKKKTEWINVKINTPEGIKTFSVECEKIADKYVSPVSGVELKNLLKLKDSLKSNLVNYYRGAKSPSFISGGYQEIITQLMEDGIIVEVKE